MDTNLAGAEGRTKVRRTGMSKTEASKEDNGQNITSITVHKTIIKAGAGIILALMFYLAYLQILGFRPFRQAVFELNRAVVIFKAADRGIQNAATAHEAEPCVNALGNVSISLNGAITVHSYWTEIGQSLDSAEQEVQLASRVLARVFNPMSQEQSALAAMYAAKVRDVVAAFKKFERRALVSYACNPCLPHRSSAMLS